MDNETKAARDTASQGYTGQAESFPMLLDTGTEHPKTNIPFIAVIDGRQFSGRSLSLVSASVSGLAGPELEAKERIALALHDAQGSVAIFHIVDHDAKCAHIVKLSKVDGLALHFFPNAVNVFWSTLHFTFDARLIQFCLQAIHDIGNECFTFNALGIQQARDLFVGVWSQASKCQIFHLPLQLPNTQTIGQGCIDIQDILRPSGLCFDSL